MASLSQQTRVLSTDSNQRSYTIQTVSSRLPFKRALLTSKWNKSQLLVKGTVRMILIVIGLKTGRKFHENQALESDWSLWQPAELYIY